jgi:outer membrane protein insertion porin family/translocation and assembly module TamA
MTRPTSLFQMAATAHVVAACLLLCAAAGCATLPEGRQVVDAVSVRAVDEQARPTSAKVDTSAVEERLATTPSPKLLGLFRGVMYDYVAFAPRTLDRDLERVERFYRARGYYDARARAAQITSPSDGHVRIAIEVEEGAPVLVSKVELTGEGALPDDVRELVTRTSTRGLRPGRPFDEDVYEKAEERLLRALTDRGYAYAKVSRQADVDLDQHTAVVTFALVPGPRCVLGEITIEGLGELPEAPVRRALDLAPGDPYSTADLETARTSVLDLGVFAGVSLRPVLATPVDASGDAPRISVVVHVDVAKLRAVQLGGGIELDLIRTDVHATIGWEHDDFLGGFRKLAITLQPALVFYPTRLPGLQVPEHYLPAGKSRVELAQPGFLEARTRGTVRAEYNVYPVLLSPDVDPTASVLGYREFRGTAALDRTL